MKFLSGFEFHDAKFTLKIFDNNLLQIEANRLNIHENAEQNRNKTDMEIADALIPFEGFLLLSYDTQTRRKWQVFYTEAPSF